MNSVDGFESLTNENTIYARATSGGRITYKKSNWQATLAGYYQYGKLQNGQTISAYYLQPEIEYKRTKFKMNLGMEYLSGNGINIPSITNQSLSTLYGVAFKFMGRLDYFTSFPSDVLGGGLINPYLFLEYTISPKWKIDLQSHAFFIQNNHYLLATVDPFLGLEYDFSLKRTITNQLFIDFGISTMNATSTMQIIKGGNSKKMPVFSYLMLT